MNQIDDFFGSLNRIMIATVRMRLLLIVIWVVAYVALLVWVLA